MIESIGRRDSRAFAARVSGLILACALAPALASPATVPSGFSDALVVGNLSGPTAMAFAPDGRLFVCEQRGTLRVVKNGALLPTPFLTVQVDNRGERGLLGVAFDPDFQTNGYVYVYYTATTPAIHNRVSRFTANGDVAVGGSELILLDLDNLTGATNHNGGAIHFGADGKLYIAVGDNNSGANAQTRANLFGKILRINRDGSIPTDNPFYTTSSGKNRAIWAMGLRNPYTFAFDRADGKMFVNDVGESSWEEINDGIAGANYGWPTTEGPTSDPRFVGPRYAYHHNVGQPTGCAITGGTFYSPPNPQFPLEYVGDYFFADYCAGWIYVLDPANGNAVASFAAGIAAPVDLRVSEDGALYYLARGDGGAGAGAVFRVSYGAGAPAITSHPSNTTAPVGGSATFSVVANGAGPLSYQWQRNGANIPGAVAASYTVSPVQASDDGARFRVVVSNAYGATTSDEAILQVSGNMSPVPTILQPPQGALYSGGSTIFISGDATDPEDGAIPASAFTWRIDFHHDTHVHPFLGPASGAKSGSFTVPTSGETSSNVWYRIHLEVRDSDGLPGSTFRDILPRKSTVTLATQPTGLQVTLNGQPMIAPASFVGVVGIMRSIGAPSPQIVNGTTWEFASWSDGGPATHDISTPNVNTTYTATFRQVTSGCTAPPGPPQNLTATATPSSTTLNWSAPAGGDPPTAYILEAGTSPGATLSTQDTGNTATTASIAPPTGRFYIRVRARNACGTGLPSNEIVLTVP